MKRAIGVEAVNGAAAKRPRKVLGAFFAVVDSLRQWGRGQTAAERPRRTTTCQSASSVNGAAAKRPRKASATPKPTASATPSMGPRPNGRGKRALATGITSPSSVNGAAAKRPRKARRKQPPVRFQGPAAHSGLGSPPCPVHPASPPPTAPPPLLASRERPAPGAPCRARSRAHTTNDGSLPPVGRAAPIVSMRPGPVPYDGPVSTTSMRSSP